jgi:rSAM/selenodomain-associated transferase 1
MHVLVMAKAPVAGRVKTRLCPPCTDEEAAMLAAAALADTLCAARSSGADRVVLALDGPPGPWLPPGVHLIAQRGHGLADRLANAWADAGGPGIQIGMDTPQVTGTLLASAIATLDERGTDAVLGLAVDGGWWAIGLRAPRRAVFAGIRMSRSDTGSQQTRRLARLGLRVRELPMLRDVDTFADALAVAADAPGTLFAAALGTLRRSAA